MSFQSSPADLVLSCTICQETPLTIYANDGRNSGLRQGSEDPHTSKITKLWLTECAHVICGKHLPGGGAPFHSIHEIPRAPCPLCSTEKDDHSDKALFFINGLSKGQYDENIPDVYFQIPPIQLSGGDLGLEALRFQYLSLLRLGTKSHEKLMGLAKALKRWEDKKPEIVRSLSIVAPLRDELLSAGRRLMALGEDVSSIEITLKHAGASLTEGLRSQQQPDMQSQYHSMEFKPAGQRSPPGDGGLCLARGSAADLDSLKQGAGIFKNFNGTTQQDPMRQDNSSSKRKRVDSGGATDHQTDYALHRGGFEKCRSRDQMPPPSVPVQQPLVYTTKGPSSDNHGLSAQRDHVNTTHLQRAPITPQRHPYQGGLRRSRFTPGSSMEPSNTSLAGAGTKTGQSHLDVCQSPRANTGTAAPVSARGGWQPSPGSFDTRHSGNFSSPSSALPSTGQVPARRSMGYHQGSLMFPIELGDRTIDPSSRSYQSVSSDGSSVYHKRQLALAMQSQLKSPAYPRDYKSSPNREGRITLLRAPSFASRHSSDRGTGLSSHVRSSSHQITRPSANSTSQRQQLVAATPIQLDVPTSAHFATHQPAYSSSLPSRGRMVPEIGRRNNSIDSGPTPVNGEMRPYSSTNGENFWLAQDSCTAPARGGAPMELQASGSRRRANR